MSIVKSMNAIILGSFLLLSSVLLVKAESITFQPPNEALQKICTLFETSNDYCKKAKKTILDNLVNPNDTIVLLGINKKGIPTAKIKRGRPINNMGCYLLEVSSNPFYTSIIHTHCQ